MSFEPAKEKLTIGSLDEPGVTVKAQYNPKELQVDQAVPWKKPDSANKTGSQAAGSAGAGDGIVLEFTGADGRRMSVEMLFDGYEPGNGRHVDVAGEVAILEKLAAVRDSKSKKEGMRRPHHCVVSWGDRGLPKFKCVIESLSTKYTMFSSEGKPLRATCTVKLREADKVDK